MKFPRKLLTLYNSSVTCSHWDVYSNYSYKKSTGRSAHKCLEPSYTGTHSSLPLHQNINKAKNRAARTVHGPMFLPFYVIIVSFFSFFCQDANKKGSNCAIIGCSFSKKHKLALHKTHSRELNYVDHKFFLYSASSYLHENLGTESKYYRAG